MKITRRTVPFLVAAAMLVTLPVLAQGSGGFGPGFGPGMRGPGGPGNGGPMGCIIQALDLDEGQQTAWEGIQAQLHETLQGLAQQHRTLQQQIHDALAGANPDATAVGQLMISSHDVAAQMQAAHEKARTDLAALLRPDQLEKYQLLTELQQTCGGRRGHTGPGLRHGPGGPGSCPGCAGGGPGGPPAD